MSETIEIGEPRRDNRRVLKLAGVAAVVILAIVVLPGLLFGGGGGGPSTEDAFPPVDPGATTTTVPATPPAETFEPFTSKDPFEPLIDVGPVVGGDGDVGQSTPGTGDDTTDTTLPPFDDDDFTFPDDEDGDDDVTFPDEDAGGETEVPDGEDGTTTTAPPGPPPRQPDRVSLLEVFVDQSDRVVASVRVNDNTYQVGEGQDFAGSYRVLDLDISTRCGQFLFGDDRFRLCEDEETLK